MEYWPLLLWIVMLGVPWALWLQRTLRERSSLRQQAQQNRAAQRRQVVQHNSDAGLQFMKESKWLEAITAFDRALAAVDADPGPEAALRFHRGFALEQMGQLEEAIAAYTDCEAVTVSRRLSETVEPDGQRADWQRLAAVRHGYLLAKLGREEEARHKLRQCVDAMEGAPPSVAELQVDALRLLLNLHQASRDHAQVATYAQEGARLARRVGNTAEEARFVQAAGDAYLALGRPEEALRSYERSLDSFRRIGEERGESSVKRDIGLLYQEAGDWEKGQAWLQACLLDEERGGNQRSQAQLCYDIACLHIDQGNLHEGGMFLQRSMSLFRQTEDRQGIDQVGRAMMGLSILVHRRVTANQMTFRDIERGSAKSKDDEKK